MHLEIEQTKQKWDKEDKGKYFKITKTWNLLLNMNSMLDSISKLLSNSNGKDKVMRIISYSAMFISSSRLVSKTSLITLASQLSYARMILRLFDDLPMLKYNIDCIKKSSSGDFSIDLLIRIINLVDQLYYPVEHLVQIPITRVNLRWKLLF